MINSPMLFPYKNIVNACIATITQLIINKTSSRFFSFSFSPFLNFLYKLSNGKIYILLPNSPFSNISAFFEEIHKSLPKMISMHLSEY
jgi:hypothetical protein